ncbi:syndecan-2-like [Scleropages formosus]|uniref:Syndecan n=1 Tax=Scleropages formosus TaxID=113540 RepID=A0A0P7Y4Y7_SCLFO|nr:syndecan-2-like [Scleropages formosus]
MALTEDLYLDQQSGDDPIDDDDFSSGSGSGIDEAPEVSVKTLYIAPEAEPTQDSTKTFTPQREMFTFRDTPSKAVDTETPFLLTDDLLNGNWVTGTTGSPAENADKPAEVSSENLFQRTEVLAAVIAGGVIGFLFATFLVLLLVYRMRKKDEGSYDLGERKPSSSAYQRAPTKEFYA